MATHEEYRARMIARMKSCPERDSKGTIYYTEPPDAWCICEECGAQTKLFHSAKAAVNSWNKSSKGDLYIPPSVNVHVYRDGKRIE